MKHRHFRPELLLTAAIAIVMLTHEPAQAVQVPCETGDPCTTGVCLPDGTCDATPANNGAACDTFNFCTVGVCANGQCDESPANNGKACETANACMQENGQCSQGECVGTTLPNGSACRPEFLGPCLTGTCMTVMSSSFCMPALKCPNGNACDLKCNPLNGNCESFPTHACDDQCSTGTCVAEPDFGYSCTNVQNKADHTSCYNGSTCDGDDDECMAGECVGSDQPGTVCGNDIVEAPEQCDDGDAVFESGDYCDALCVLVPCGKPTNSSGALPKASDALFTLRAAVQSVTCDLPVCDVNHSNTITASDALVVLKKAVGLAVTLNCPPPGGGGA